MPSALATTRSIGVVTNPRTRSALAPTYTVVTCTTAMSLRGYCRTLSDRIACNPAIRMTRFTTIASTGRLTNKSVNFMSALTAANERNIPHPALRPFSAKSKRFDDLLNLAVLRFRSRVVVGLHRVVDHDRCPIAQLEHSRAHNFIAGIQAGHNRHLIAARPFNSHHLLTHAAVAVPLRILHIADDENRISVGSVVNGRRGQRHHITRTSHR